jgi:hypothetical protein
MPAEGGSLPGQLHMLKVVILSVTNGRDAIWSGACSSDGEKRRCTLTLNADVSVCANVQ